MARLAQPRRKVFAVMVHARIDGEKVVVREPYNIVSLDFGDGSQTRTFIEPAGVLLRQPSPDDALAGADATQRPEIYDEVRFYGAPPFPKSRFGVLF